MQAMRNSPPRPGAAVVRTRNRRMLHSGTKLDCDVCVCGGTLGLLLALALQVTLACRFAALQQPAGNPPHATQHQQCLRASADRPYKPASLPTDLSQTWSTPELQRA